MDDAYTFLLQGDMQNGNDTLNNGLIARRVASTIDEWRNFVTSQALTHPIKELLHLCPFTHRAFYKPRGYAGDAVLMDFMYGEGEAKDLQLKGMALAISHYTLNAPVVRANRYRRQLLAQRIDEAAMNENKPTVLSIAAGHLREMELSQAARNGQVGRIYALDQDTESVALIQREYSHYNVSAAVGSVRQLLNGKIKFADLSLVYAAGLFDYLADRTAQRLIEVMFSFLKSGGRMLVANLVPNLPSVGYMESYMDWYLIYRSSDELVKLFATLPQDKVADLLVSFDPDNNMVFVEAIKR